MKQKQESNNKYKSRIFDCPSCGNPLLESFRDTIKCPYCGTIVVPKNRKLHREESIYEKKSNQE